jgi:hypothetical protein
MRTFGLSFLAAAAVLASAPAAAQGRSATVPVRHGYHSDPLANALGARLASINARIAMLRDRGALGSEEAEELRKQSRRLELRLYGLSRREAGDVELGIDRLESAVRFAADDARWGGHSFNRELNDRYGDRARDEQNRYEARRDKDYENFDRYTGSSVDRWHDPFDRGN